MVRRTHQICPKRAECETRLTALSLCLNMEPHKHQSQDDPYFQSSIACNRLRSGSPGNQWVCCPPFEANVHVSRQKWSNLQGIYHLDVQSYYLYSTLYQVVKVTRKDLQRLAGRFLCFAPKMDLGHFRWKTPSTSLRGCPKRLGRLIDMEKRGATSDKIGRGRRKMSVTKGSQSALERLAIRWKSIRLIFPMGSGAS
jgi:hypothetical protein